MNHDKAQQKSPNPMKLSRFQNGDGFAGVPHQGPPKAENAKKMHAKIKSTKCAPTRP
jgi:hypothetical protein